MYESPIKLIQDEIRYEMENNVLKAVQNIGVNVDKEELIKALKCDRGQYDKGYDACLDEHRDAIEKQIPKKPIGTYTDFKCSVCGRRVRSGKGSSSKQRDNFCQKCGQKLDWTVE